VEGRRIENLISGVDRAAQGNPIGGLDANSLLNGVAQGQGQRASAGDITTNNVGADIANQIAGGSSTSIDDILNGLNGQDQTPPINQSTPQEQGPAAAQSGNQGIRNDINSGDIAGDLANQLASKAGSGENSVQDVAGDLANQLVPNGQEQLPQSSQASAQQSGGNAQIIQVVSTMITEADGQKIATAVIEAAASGRYLECHLQPA
jgi:hypothetical protein